MSQNNSSDKLPRVLIADDDDAARIRQLRGVGAIIGISRVDDEEGEGAPEEKRALNQVY